MDRSVRFYRDVLGLPVGYASPHWTTVEVGDLRIGLHPAFGESVKNQGGWVVMFEVDDVRAFRERLLVAGSNPEPFHEVPSGVLFSFQDPDGNRIQALQLGLKLADLT